MASRANSWAALIFQANLKKYLGKGYEDVAPLYEIRPSKTAT